MFGKIKSKQIFLSQRIPALKVLSILTLYAEAQSWQPSDSFFVLWPENILAIIPTQIKMNYVFALIRAHIQVLEPAAAFNYDLAQTADLNLRWREICAPPPSLAWNPSRTDTDLEEMLL